MKCVEYNTEMHAHLFSALTYLPVDVRLKPRRKCQLRLVALKAQDPPGDGAHAGKRTPTAHDFPRDTAVYI